MRVLPWWLSGKESSCQCRNTGSVPDLGRSQHAAGELSPCATTIELVLQSLGIINTEAKCHHCLSQLTLGPDSATKEAPVMASLCTASKEQPPVTTPRQKPTHHEDPTQPKINKIIKIETTMRQHLVPIRMAIFKKTKRTNAGKDTEKKEPLFTVSVNINSQPAQKTVEKFLKKLKT